MPNKTLEVSNLIKDFLNKNKKLYVLQEYAWKNIDEYLARNQIEEIIDADTPVFWFAIWQLHHLADEEHLRDGTLERNLKQTLQYLLNQSPMPPNAYGLPPNVKKQK